MRVSSVTVGFIGKRTSVQYDGGVRRCDSRNGHSFGPFQAYVPIPCMICPCLKELLSSRANVATVHATSFRWFQSSTLKPPQSVPFISPSACPTLCS